MPRPYQISIQVDGATRKGDWQLLQGCKAYVRSAWGNDTVEAGKENPEAVAKRTLERLVRTDEKTRADWRAKELARWKHPS